MTITPPHSTPPHRGFVVPGIHAYADALSVHAGGRIGFHVSATAAFQLSIIELGPDVGDPDGDIVHHAFEEQPAHPQAIHPGSYVAVARGLPASGCPDGFTVECWLKRWNSDQRQAIASESNDGEGWLLGLDPGGVLSFANGEMIVRGPVLPLRRWTHVAATWDRATMRLFVDGAEVASGPSSARLRCGRAPLRLGAAGLGGEAALHLDGDLAMPVLYGRALDQAALFARYTAGGISLPSGSDVLACWPLHEDRGSRITDVSGHDRTGSIINHATWMIGGPRMDPSRAPEFEDNGYDPLFDATRGHGLRLASDDLYDCGWEESHAYTLPVDAKSGLFVARIAYVFDGEPLTYDVTFVVKAARSAAPAPLLVLCATNSWLAYNSSPFPAPGGRDPTWPRRAAGLPSATPEVPAYSTYLFHRAGQPTFYAGLRMPCRSASPDALYAPEGIGFGQWARMERYLHTWLDAEGYQYDVVSDLDLHRDPDLLRAYKSVIIAGHSEYWSVPALDGLDNYLRAGGTTIVLSGNSLYWRVTFDDDATVMEQRKTAADGDPLAPPAGPYSEQYHSQDWKRGGCLRFQGRSSADLIGLETAGWAFADGEDFGVYHVADPGHFLFAGEAFGNVREGDTFGHAAQGALPRAIGHEWDLTVSTIRHMTVGPVPAGGALPSIHDGIEIIARGMRRVPGRMDGYLDWFNRPTRSLDGLSAEMIYWERPQGGQVFNAGACAACWVLGTDQRFSALMNNVLRHFGIGRGARRAG